MQNKKSIIWSFQLYVKDICRETPKVARDWSVQIVYSAAVNRLRKENLHDRIAIT